MPQPLLVVADYYQLAVNYARRHNLGRHWRHITRLHQIQGIRGPGEYVSLKAVENHSRDEAEREEIVRWLRAYGFTHVDHAGAAAEREG